MNPHNRFLGYLALTSRCRHCDNEKSAHVGDPRVCLFSSRAFEPVWTKKRFPTATEIRAACTHPQMGHGDLHICMLCGFARNQSEAEADDTNTTTEEKGEI